MGPFEKTNMNIYSILCINLKFARLPKNAVYIDNIDKKNTDMFQLIIFNMFRVILSFCHACLCMLCKNELVT